jgi:hypothetical protein
MTGEENLRFDGGKPGDRLWKAAACTWKTPLSAWKTGRIRWKNGAPAVDELWKSLSKSGL